MNNTVENDFLFPKVQWLHLTGKVDNLKIFVSNFLRISHAKKHYHYQNITLLQST